MSRPLRILLSLLLLGGLAAVLYQVWQSRQSYVSNASGSFSIEDLTLQRDFGNFILNLEVAATNPSSQATTLGPPQLRLLGPSGQTFPLYQLTHLPSYQPPPRLAAGERARTSLAYWLSTEELGLELHLAFLEERLLVKKAGLPPLSSLPAEQKELRHRFPHPDWTSP
ncbi:MAG: hypothetical protein AAF555_11345 [Verrucomicrobiota bacterium]